MESEFIVSKSGDYVLRVFGNDGGGNLFLFFDGGERRLVGTAGEVGNNGGGAFFQEAFRGQFAFTRYEVAGVVFDIRRCV